MTENDWIIRVPAFVDKLVASVGELTDEADGVALAIRLSRENMELGAGPFGAVVAAGEQIVAAGVNCVLASRLSIAHAEIVAIARAQQADAPAQPLTLYTSTEPCCQCFGALLWSGVTRLICAATTVDAEAIGFDEGPKPADWTSELERRGISVSLERQRADARTVLQTYASRGGLIYGRGSTR